MMLRLIVAATLFFGFPVSVWAQTLGTSEIMLSRGTIFTFREGLSPRSYPDTFNGRECPACHYVLAPGEFVLTFPSRQPALANGRIPIITKSGIFGSARGFSEARYEYLISEAEIARMQQMRGDSKQKITEWLITVRDQVIDRDLSFTRGEILPMETIGGVAVVKIRKNDARLAPKHAELRASRAVMPASTESSRITIDEDEARIPIGSDDSDSSKFIKIDFDEFSELMSRRPSVRADLSTYWPRMVKSASPSLRVGCSETVTLSSSTETESGRKAQAGFKLALTEITRFVDLDLGAGYDFSERYKQSIASTETIKSKGFELNSIAVLMPSSGANIAHIGNEVICPEFEMRNSRIFRAAVPGVGDWAVTLDVYQQLANEFEKDKAVIWERNSGKLLVSCYYSGYRKLKQSLNKILSNESFTDAFLTQALRINYDQPGNSLPQFFSC